MRFDRDGEVADRGELGPSPTLLAPADGASLRVRREVELRWEPVAQADHYRVTLDLSKASGASASTARISNYEAWLDSEGRMVKVLMTAEMGGTKTVTEVLVSKYNEPVEIKAPADYTEMPG